jgi:hypothetical protein
MMKNRPVHEVRRDSIKVAVWKKDTEIGVRYNTAFTRLYRYGEQWKTSESFGRSSVADRLRSPQSVRVPSRPVDCSPVRLAPPAGKRGGFCSPVAPDAVR